MQDYQVDIWDMRKPFVRLGRDSSSQTVKEWCLMYESCAARKAPIPRSRGPLQNVKAGYPLQLVAVDITLSKTKNS